MPPTQTFRFGNGAARWANRVLELLEENHRIVPATHATTAAIGDDSRDVDAHSRVPNAGASMKRKSAGAGAKGLRDGGAELGAFH